MVTQIVKKPKVAVRRKAIASNGALPAHPAHADAREPLEHPEADPAPVQEPRQGLVERGQDAVSREAGSLAAVAAVGVGAALIEVELIPGLILGAGAVLLGKMFPELGHQVRPVLKSAISAGFSVAQKARELMAEASEQVHDLVAEVRHERHQAGAAPATSQAGTVQAGPIDAPGKAHRPDGATAH